MSDMNSVFNSYVTHDSRVFYLSSKKYKKKPKYLMKTLFYSEKNDQMLQNAQIHFFQGQRTKKWQIVSKLAMKRPIWQP